MVSWLATVPGARVLDLGCGDGLYTGILRREGFEVTGLDPSRTALERARQAHPDIDFTTPEGSGRLPFDDGSFDGVACLHVLEHVADLQLLLSELRRVLAARGLLGIAVPNSSWLRQVVRGPWAYERQHDPLEPTLKFFTRRTLRELLGQFSFEQIQVERAHGDLRATASKPAS